MFVETKAVGEPQVSGIAYNILCGTRQRLSEPGHWTKGFPDDKQDCLSTALTKETMRHLGLSARGYKQVVIILHQFVMQQIMKYNKITHQFDGFVGVEGLEDAGIPFWNDHPMVTLSDVQVVLSLAILDSFTIEDAIEKARAPMAPPWWMTYGPVETGGMYVVGGTGVFVMPDLALTEMTMEHAMAKTILALPPPKKAPVGALVDLSAW